MNHHPIRIILALSLLTLWLAACGDRETASYAADVRPVLDEYCMECHQTGGAGEVASSFSMETYADLMKGTDNGPMVIAEDPLGSNLIKAAQDAVDEAHASNGTAFLMQATTMEELRSVCQAGEVMPQKSTFFYPKVYSGLVAQRLE